MKKKETLKFKTIILSDVHLGTRDCKIDEVNFLLKHSHSEQLILNGDIIDGWSLSRKGGWNKQHTRFVRLILKKLEKKDTEVIYLRGNHDDVLYRFLPLEFDRLHIVNEYIHPTPNGDYLVVHGDGFDSITTNHRWIALLGDVGYQTLLRINRIYNRYRAWRGKPYYSLSKEIKARVKGAVSFIDKFEDKLRDLARERKCRGVICGHIHTAANKQIEDIHYLNSGDWVESLTALVENFDGSFEILDFSEFQRRLEEKANQTGNSPEDELPPVEEDPAWEKEVAFVAQPHSA